MYTSIVATSETLRERLRAGFRSDVGPSGLAALFSGTMVVSMASPRQMRGVEDVYRSQSRELTLEEWEKQPLRSTVLDNLARLTSALQ